MHDAAVGAQVGLRVRPLNGLQLLQRALVISYLHAELNSLIWYWWTRCWCYRCCHIMTVWDIDWKCWAACHLLWILVVWDSCTPRVCTTCHFKRQHPATSGTLILRSGHMSLTCSLVSRVTWSPMFVCPFMDVLSGAHNPCEGLLLVDGGDLLWMCWLTRKRPSHMTWSYRMMYHRVRHACIHRPSGIGRKISSMWQSTIPRYGLVFVMTVWCCMTLEDVPASSVAKPECQSMHFQSHAYMGLLYRSKLCLCI